MELMVYIAILGIIVIVAGQAFSGNTKFRIRSRNMIKANEVTEAVASMFMEDVSQMGVKSYKVSGDASTPDQFGKSSLVYMDPDDEFDPDSSSFSLKKDANGDSLVIRRLRLDANGGFDAVEEVSWYKQGSNIYRSCKTLQTNATAPSDCPSGNPSVVELANDVEAFAVVPAHPGVVSDGSTSAAKKSIVLPDVSASETTLPFRFVSRYNVSGTGASGSGTGMQYFALTNSPADGGERQELSGFVSNYDKTHNVIETDGKKVGQVFVARANTGTAVNDGSDWPNLCTKISLDSMMEYEISFNVLYNEDSRRLFCPGRDHAAVGFRALTGGMVNGLDDFMFYAPTTEFEPSLRSFRFGVRRSVKQVCMAFTFASYSPSAGGTITISDLVLKKVESSNYNFEDSIYNPEISDKQNVKAFQFRVRVNKGGESNEILQVVPTPSNGPRD